MSLFPGYETIKVIMELDLSSTRTMAISNSPLLSSLTTNFRSMYQNTTNEPRWIFHQRATSSR
uniref:Uncharacterized protein n=1 Tax=Arundo donax TaxID=35708 RepID=A0A0A9D879_ARUDO